MISGSAGCAASSAAAGACFVTGAGAAALAAQRLSGAAAASAERQRGSRLHGNRPGLSGSAFRQVAAREPAILFAQARRECSRILLAHDREHAFGVRFAREEAEPQAMPRAAVFVARDLIETIVLQTRDVVAVESHRRDRRAQIDDEQRRAGAAAPAPMGASGGVTASCRPCWCSFPRLLPHARIANRRTSSDSRPDVIHFDGGGSALDAFRARHGRFRVSLFIGSCRVGRWRIRCRDRIAAPWQPRCLRK